MPIDFAAIADQFRAPLEQQLRTATTAFSQIGKWVKKRVSEAEAAERSTRGMPILLYHRGALTVYVDPSQWGTLGIGMPSPSLWNRIAEGARRFWRGLLLAPHLYREEMVLPNAYRAIRDSIDLILTSVERFVPLAVPGPNRSLHLFDLDRPGRASDVFGGGALLGYTYLASRRAIDRLTADANALVGQATDVDWGGLISPVRGAVGDLMAAFGRGSADSPQRRAAPSGEQSPENALGWSGLAALLRTAVEGIVGAIMILPLIPKLVGPLVEAAFLHGKTLALKEFRSIEALVFDARAAIIDAFTEKLPSFGTRLFDLLVATDFVLTQYLDYVVRFSVEYLGETFTRFYPYLRRVGRFMLTVSRLADMMRRMWEMVMNFDLVPVLLRLIGIPPSVLSLVPSPPSITVGDVLEAMVYGRVESVLIGLTSWLIVLEAAFATSPAGIADRLAGSPIARRIAAARRITATAAVRLPQSYIDRPRPTPAPGPLTIRFPNVARTMIGSSAAMRAMERDLRLLALQTRLSTAEIFLAGAVALDRSAVAFDEAAQTAATLGDPDRYEGVLGWAERLSGEVYGDQLTALRGRTQLSSFGRDYDAFLARRGFDIVEAVLPLYLDAMRGYWRDRVLDRAEGRFAPPSGLPPYELPTSPHIVDRRVRLGRVRMPRMTIRASERPVDRGLAEAVSAHFRGEVERAYAQGLETLSN